VDLAHVGQRKEAWMGPRSANVNGQPLKVLLRHVSGERGHQGCDVSRGKGGVLGGQPSVISPTWGGPVDEIPLNPGIQALGRGGAEEVQAVPWRIGEPTDT